MLITQEELEQFSGTYPDDNDTQTIIQETYLNSATEIINNYLCFDCEAETEENPFYNAEAEKVTVPQVVKMVCFEIATLLQLEQGNNIGINNKSFEVGGSRSFLNVVDFTKYLNKISCYRKAFI